MNYSKKHLKKIAYNNICDYHNRIVYVYSRLGEYMYCDHVGFYRAAARHYSNDKIYSKW